MGKWPIMVSATRETRSRSIHKTKSDHSLQLYHEAVDTNCCIVTGYHFNLILLNAMSNIRVCVQSIRVCACGRKVSGSMNSVRRENDISSLIKTWRRGGGGGGCMGSDSSTYCTACSDRTVFGGRLKRYTPITKRGQYSDYTPITKHGQYSDITKHGQYYDIHQ